MRTRPAVPFFSCLIPRRISSPILRAGGFFIVDLPFDLPKSAPFPTSRDSPPELAKTAEPGIRGPALGQRQERFAIADTNRGRDIARPAW